ncbi:hypothetical protein PZ938_14050 [Luteipulveratus sp. YIM 133132]|uniref:hypothetical protein n=1 Tax=Luteipulveratus flavus TaxID=3031728 RepID=UPI0023AED0AE|nr:hypothetical protein [Luteipulveratus sp. YIM 133132]MDE9366732.1 hypothetical protein [Luteipulveratus sp. YIM 133132]
MRARRQPRRPVVASPAVALAVLLAGCGSTAPSAAPPTPDSVGSATGSPSSSGAAAAPSSTSPTSASRWEDPAYLLSRSADAVEKYKSVHIVGDLRDDPILHFDLRGRIDGRNERAEISEGGMLYTRLTTGGRTYIDADSDFWTAHGQSGPRAARLAKGLVRVEGFAHEVEPRATFATTVALNLRDASKEPDAYRVDLSTASDGRPVANVLPSDRRKSESLLFSATIDLRTQLPERVSFGFADFELGSWGAVKEFPRPKDVVNASPIDLEREPGAPA